MRSAPRISMLAAVLAFVASNVWADEEIVIAIRYLQAEGTSHAHLYLYREDGKLLRQLTNDNSGQDVDPVFADDGNTIIFTRQKPNKSPEFFSVAPRGGNEKNVAAAPEWYANTKDSPFFTNVEEPEAAEGSATPSPSPDAPPIGIALPDPDGAPRSYKSPDESVEIVIREDRNDPNDDGDSKAHGKHYLLRDLKSGKEIEFGKLPGFDGAYELLYDSQHKDRHFLFDGPLRLAFFGVHVESQTGDISFALDLNKPRLVALSANWAAPIPLPGDAAFLTANYERYVPIPNSSKTANCCFIERWDKALNKVRYARNGSAAISYGVSMYRPSGNPHVITLRQAPRRE